MAGPDSNLTLVLIQRDKSVVNTTDDLLLQNTSNA